MRVGDEVTFGSDLQKKSLAERDAPSRELIDEAEAIAAALVIDTDQRESHWTAAARGLMRGLILMALKQDDVEHSTY
jgi:hypothetical protein